jgi:ankyrin repeat protein
MSLDEELLKSAEKGDIIKVIELLRRGANVNIKDRKGWTPLHYVAASGRADITRWLLENRPDVNARDDNGLTPLHYASLGSFDVTWVLIKNGANVNIRDRNGWTPLHYAVASAASDTICAYIVRLLLENGADPNIKDNNGRTVLDLAYEKRCYEVARIIEEFTSKKSSQTRVYE